MLYLFCICGKTFSRNGYPIFGKVAMEKNEVNLNYRRFSSDEIEIIEGWRTVKRSRKGHLQVSLKSDGTQFYLEYTPAKEGRVDSSKENR